MTHDLARSLRSFAVPPVAALVAAALLVPTSPDWARAQANG